MLIVLLSQKKLGNRRILWGIAVTVTLVLLVLLANSAVVQRLITLSHEGESVSMEARQACWDGTRELIQDHTWLGTGPGTYGDAYTQYQPPGFSVRFYQAHNDYLEIVAELGIPAIPIMIWLLFLFFKTGFSRMRSPSRQTRSVALGCMIAVVAILLHSYSDFNFQIPANAVLFAILTALI